MTTVTSLTADRMLAIEAASVIDGDVDANGNLILTTKGGTKINAGSVIGPKGDPGPVGQDKTVINTVPVLDVGMVNQIRAGRQLSAADFANIGLNAPAGLWNLSDLTDVSGNGRNLTNKGGVVFDAGINGLANTAAKFSGANTQVLYIPDTGASDPFRLRTGSFGCWFRTAKRNAVNMYIDKYASVGNQNYCMFSDGNGKLNGWGSPDGTANTILTSSSSDVADDRWHFGVFTFDGTNARLYIDGILEANVSTQSISMYPGASVLNIGGRGGDASNNTSQPCYGRVDEAFVTQDVLSEEQIRNLYCAKFTHTLGALPTRISLRVRRRRKGSSFSVVDFSTQPLRLYNFSAGSFADEGSNNAPLTNSGSVAVAGVDGTALNSMLFYGPSPTYLAATDVGLPSGVASRSYGCWFKAQIGVINANIVAWGQTPATNDTRIMLDANGRLNAWSGADGIIGPFIADGLWHFGVVVEDNTEFNGIKRKLYLDGALVGISTVMNAAGLGGVNFFRIGVGSTGSGGFTGHIDSVFVCGYAMAPHEIRALYAKGSQALAPSPKNAGDHVESLSVNDLLATFDTLDSQHQVDLSVA